MYYVYPGGIDVCAINTSWISSFLNVMSKMIPNQIVTTSKRLPWITKDIVSLIRKKVPFYHQAVRSNSTCAWAKYKHARNSVVGALRSAKSDFLLSFSASLKVPKNSGLYINLPLAADSLYHIHFISMINKLIMILPKLIYLTPILF